MLKVIIDATPVLPKPSGVGLYVSNLIFSLYALQEEHNFELGIAYQPGMKNWLRGNLYFPHLLANYCKLHRVPLPTRISNFLFSQFPIIFQSYFESFLESPNVIHGTNYFVYPSKNSLNVITIYDLTFLKYPQYIDSVVKQYAKQVRKCLKWIDLIITISESSKKDIVEYLQVDPSRIYVTPLASRYYPSYSIDQTLNKELSDLPNYDFYLSTPYILFVSTIEPRKNIINLVAAFNLLKSSHKIEHNLFLIGKKGWNYDSTFEAIKNSKWRNEIYHLDYLSDESVALFYSKADAFVYPSYYEGFGLPVLEAMTLGAPVVTSNTSSLPEVAGDAALFIDPNDPEEIAEAIFKLISNSQLRSELIDKGKERAKLFSWQKTARETLKAYKSII